MSRRSAATRLAVLATAAGSAGLAALAPAGCGGREVAAPGIAAAAPAEADDPWPMFRREPRHGGDARDHAALAWEVAWQTELEARVDASPIVVDRGIVVATRAGFVALLDPATGRQRANVALDGDVWATPTASRGVIVVGVRRGGRGELVGLDAHDLHVRWRRGVRSGVFGGGTAAGGAVWLCNGAALVAVSVDDGRELTRVDAGDRCYGAPAIDGDVVYVASRDGGVRAVGRDGTPRWRAETSPGADNDATPVLADELVLVGSNDGHLHAFDRDGAARWRVGDGEWVVSAPAVAEVRAVALADGAERWRGTTGGDVASSPVVIGEHVVHGAHDGKLHAWRLADGAPLAPIDAGAAMFASPAVTREGLVVIATHAGRVVAVR